MKYPKLRELKEAIRALLKGPYTTKFPFKPHEPFERFRGRPKFYTDDCVGCTACAQVCPPQAIDWEDQVAEGKAVRKLTVHWDICIFCGQCQANCLTGKGIMLSRDFDLATTEKREDLNQQIDKELLLCDSCSEPVAPYDQYLWAAKKLGPLCFTNASLILFYLANLGLALSPGRGSQKNEPLLRRDRFKILCPRCRREAALKS